MVHREGQGSLILDIRLGKLGRLKRVSGTDDPNLLADMKRTLRLLRDEHPPRYDVLALVLCGELHPLDLHKAYIRGELNTLPTSDELRPLEEVVKAWIRTHDRAPRTVESYESCLLSLTGANVSLNDLPSVLAVKRAQAMVSGKRQTFNRTLTAARVMLRRIVGPRHRLFEAVERIEALRVTPREGNPQTREQVRQIVADLKQHGSNVWALALSGMRREEYFTGAWRMLPDRIFIPGSKTSAGKRRSAPAIYPISAPTCKGVTLSHLMQKATNDTVRIHDLRYTYVRWLEDAGIPAVRIDWYTGHAVANVSELYRRGRGFEEYLVKDAERVREWFGEPPTLGLRVMGA